MESKSLRKTLERIAHELRTYNPAADEYKGEHIHKVWAREIEAALAAPAQSEVKPVEFFAEIASRYPCPVCKAPSAAPARQSFVSDWTKAIREMPKVGAAPAGDGGDAVPDRNRDQIVDWLLTDPTSGERLHFAGPLELDFRRFSRVQMRSESGSIWTLTARLEEGYLTASQRIANIRRIAKEEGDE